MQLYRQLMNLFPRINSAVDFLLRNRQFAFLVLRSKVSVPRLHAQSSRGLQLYLQRMKGPVRFQILRLEAKHVDVLGWRHQSPEAAVEIVTVLNERPSGPSGHFR